MRSFNKARLIDIHEKQLDPTQKHVVGPDGRLHQEVKEQKNLIESNYEKERGQTEQVALEETPEAVVEELSDQQSAQVVTTTSKKTKKKTASKN